MHPLIKRAFDMGAQQALADLGLPGLDLDAMLQDTQGALSDAGGGSAGDAGSVAQNAIGDSPDAAYSLLGALATSKQAAYGDELEDGPYSLGLSSLGMLGGAAAGRHLGGKDLASLLIGTSLGTSVGFATGNAIDRHNYNAQLLPRLRQALGLEEEA